MLEDDTRAITIAACNNSPPRINDTCHAAAYTVLCRMDSTHLCARCETRVHATNHIEPRHERVCVCETCHHAHAAFLCKADATLLCPSCDEYIHSTNSVAGHHHGLPIKDDGFVSSHGCGGGGGEVEVDKEDEGVDVEDENEAASWLLLHPVKNNSSNNSNDEYLDQVDCNYRHQNQNQHQLQGHNFQLGLDFDHSPRFSYNGSIGQTVSVSSIDVGIVPESTMRDVIISHPSPSKRTIDLFYGPPCLLTPMDREARVLKTRKFEKTVRYASRKAYAETRPRVKGRFAKRTDIEAEVDEIFSSSLITEDEYGIVPSFLI